MAVRGSTNHYLIANIQRRHWIAQAKQVRLGAEAAKQLIEEVIESTAAVIGQAS
jgi:serine/threonine-protein kinase HipA